MDNYGFLSTALVVDDECVNIKKPYNILKDDYQ